MHWTGITIDQHSTTRDLANESTRQTNVHCAVFRGCLGDRNALGAKFAKCKQMVANARAPDRLESLSKPHAESVHAPGRCDDSGQPFAGPHVNRGAPD